MHDIPDQERDQQVDVLSALWWATSGHRYALAAHQGQCSETAVKRGFHRLLRVSCRALRPFTGKFIPMIANYLAKRRTAAHGETVRDDFGGFRKRITPVRPTPSCHAIDFGLSPLTIPITTVRPAVQSSEVYPPICRPAHLKLIRVGG